LRNQGRDVFDAWLNHTRLGYNYRMDELSAALGLVQTHRLDELLAKRAQVAAWYDKRIDEIGGLEKPFIHPNTTRMSWFVYVFRCQEGVSRNRLMQQLSEHDIPCRPYFTPIHLQPFYWEKFGFKLGDLPHTERAGETFLALPFSSVMSEDMVDVVRELLQTGVSETR
jgi:perosamine synthetase